MEKRLQMLHASKMNLVNVAGRRESNVAFLQLSRFLRLGTDARSDSCRRLTTLPGCLLAVPGCVAGLCCRNLLLKGKDEESVTFVELV